MPDCLNDSYRIKDIDSNAVERNKLYDYWVSKPKVKERFSKKNGVIDHESAKQNLEWFAEEVLKVPYKNDQILTPKQVDRLKTSIDYYNKDLKGRFKNMMGFIAVPRGLARLDPTSHNFLMRLERIKNYERNSMAFVEDSIQIIKDRILYAHAKDSKTTFFGKNLSYEKFRKLRQNLLEADDRSIAADARGKINEFLATDDGKLLDQYNRLLKLDIDELGKARYFYQDDPFTGAKNVKHTYEPSVIEAVAQTKHLLGKVGNIHIKSLEGLTKLVQIKFGKNSARARTIQAKVSAIKEAIKTGTEKGNYFPSVPLETLHELRVKVDNMLADKDISNSGAIIDSAVPLLDRVLSSIDQNRTPENLKPKNKALNTIWDNDPFVVVEKYARDAVEFNRNVHTQETYLEALKNIPSMSTPFVRSMKNFIIEEYAVFSEGTRGRPDWVNNMVRTINGFQTARTMGLNVTGGVKNALSISHFFAKVGLTSIKDSKRLYKGELKAIVDRVEEEEGFLFAAKDAAIFVEGFTGRDKLKEGDLVWDDAKGTWKYQDRNLREFIDQSKDLTISKLLFFHRLTENAQRKKMFRTSFIMKYKQLKDSGYVQEKDIIRFSKNFALSMVNGWAYEYSPFAKNKYVRGDGMIVDEIGDIAVVRKPVRGGLSEIGLHLMHYPMSLMETHAKELRGAKEAFVAGQGLESSEIRYLMNYAGVFGMINLASIVLNGNLNNIVENETFSRILRIERDLTEYDNKDKATFGLLSEVTGPTIGHLKYASIVSGLISLDTPFNKIMYGNVDYSDVQNENVLRYSDYQYSTEYGRMKHKILPAIRDGRGMDLVRHYLAFYPSETIKKARELLGLKKASQFKSNKAREQAIASLRHFG